jgi:hypothetical protein
MESHPEYTFPEFIYSYNHDCRLFGSHDGEEEDKCECISCTRLTRTCTKCIEIQSKIQELKDSIDVHINSFREELIVYNKMNYMYIDTIQLIYRRIKELQHIVDNGTHLYLSRLSPITIPK